MIATKYWICERQFRKQKGSHTEGEALGGDRVLTEPIDGSRTYRTTGPYSDRTNMYVASIHAIAPCPSLKSDKVFGSGGARRGL